MRITRFVVLRSAAHQAGGKGRFVNCAVHLPCRDLFDQIKQGAPVSVSHLQQRLARRTIKRQGTVQFLLGPLCQTFKVRQGQTLKHHDLRTGHDSCIQLETRVFCRGPNEQDRTVLHVG